MDEFDDTSHRFEKMLRTHRDVKKNRICDLEYGIQCFLEFIYALNCTSRWNDLESIYDYVNQMC